jgi:TolB-like protein
MRRAVALACLMLGLCIAGAAGAARPKIAVLGLEVVPGPTGVVDPAVTQLARDITMELRARAQASSSPYAVAANSAKELTDEKLLKSCDNEAVSCMATIGAGLSADFLLYGHIERRGDMFRVSLTLLDVKARTVEAGDDDLPVGGGVAALSKKMYAKLVGENAPVTTGTMVVRARARTGNLLDARVMVDEQPRGRLADGRFALSGLTEGRHVVAIESTGFDRFEDTVAIRAGQQSLLDALLVEKRAPAPERSAVWKWTLGAGIAIAVAGGAFAYYSNDRMVNHNQVTFEAALRGDGVLYSDPSPPNSDDCGLSAAKIAEKKHARVTNPDVFDRACTWKNRIYIGFGVAAVGALGAIASLVVLTRDSDAERTGARGKKSLAIAPMIGPNRTGASLSITW